MFQDIAFLVSRGVAYDEARRMPEVRRMAMVVALGEAEDRTYDWDRHAWKKD